MRMKRTIIFSLIALFILSSSAFGIIELLYCKVSSLNVREGPGTNYKIIGKIKKFDVIEVEEEIKDWVYFTNKNFPSGGWVHKKYLVADRKAIPQQEKAKGTKKARREKTKKIDPTLENISGLYAECAAYYTIVYNAMILSNASEAAANYGQSQKAAIKYSLMLASEGRSAEMAAEVTKSGMKMYNKKMKQETGNDIANISILINKYHFQCNEALKDPEKYISLSKEKLRKKAKK